MSSRPYVRLPRALAEDETAAADFVGRLASFLSSGGAPTQPPGGAGPPNACDEDPHCVYLGYMEFQGVLYKVYDCDGDIAIYPV